MTARFLHWLLLVVLVFDLASSPFHAHAHDLGAQKLPGIGAAHLENHVDSDSDLDHDRGTIGHSVSAIRAIRASTDTQHAAQVQAPAALPAVLASQLAQDARVLGSPAPVRPPWRRPAHLRPDGRAPPTLHA